MYEGIHFCMPEYFENNLIVKELEKLKLFLFWDGVYVFNGFKG